MSGYRRILVTGGAGFIGSHLVDKLIECGYAVRVLDNLCPQVHGSERQRPSYLNPDAELIIGDVRDRQAVARALQDIEVIYHFAAMTGVGQSMYQITDYVDTNVLGTAVLWEEIVATGSRVEHVILASSRAVYGEGACHCDTCREVSPAGRSDLALEQKRWELICERCGQTLHPIPTRESEPLYPVSIYGITKRVQEEICLTLGRTYSIGVTVLRFFNVYGPRQALNNPYTGIAATFASRLLSGNPIEIYEDGQIGRDFIHVSDAVRANLLVLSRGPATFGQIYNVGTGQRTAVLGLATLLSDLLGKPRHLVFSGRYRKGDIRDCFADTEHARRDLGFETQIGFTTGVADLVEWVRTQLWQDNYAKALEELVSRSLIS